MLFYIQSVKTGKFWCGSNFGKSLWGDFSHSLGFEDLQNAFYMMGFCSRTSRPKVVCFSAGRLYNVSPAKKIRVL